MPRQARIDAPGALHHLIIRGIDRTDIFWDDRERESFLERLFDLILESRTLCYTWALTSNHAHLLLRTGSAPIAAIMRRLLSGYAMNFNRRHRRHGHLFYNRYKSILCEEERYRRQLESTLKQAGEGYERRMWLQNAGLGRSEVVEVACRHSGIAPEELTTRTQQSRIARARALIGYLATRELSVPGSEVARRFRQDRSAVSRAVAQAGRDAEMRETAKALLKELSSILNQR